MHAAGKCHILTARQSSAAGRRVRTGLFPDCARIELTAFFRCYNVPLIGDSELFFHLPRLRE